MLLAKNGVRHQAALKSEVDTASTVPRGVGVRIVSTTVMVMGQLWPH